MCCNVPSSNCAIKEIILVGIGVECLDVDVSVWLSEGWLYYWWKVNIDHNYYGSYRRGLGRTV